MEQIIFENAIKIDEALPKTIQKPAAYSEFSLAAQPDGGLLPTAALTTPYITTVPEANINEITAGEDITKGDLVAIGRIQTTDFVQIAADAYTDFNNPNINYNGNNLVCEMSGGSSLKKIFLKFNTGFTNQPSQFNRVFLKLWKSSASACQIRIEVVTASWSESTITYNTEPTVNTSSDRLRLEVSFAAAAGYYSVDITPLFCAFDSGDLLNYGVRISALNDTTGTFVARTGGSTNLPQISMRGLYDTDKAWKAKNDYPLDYYAVIGFSNETKLTGEVMDVNYGGITDNLLTGLTAGTTYYVSNTAGSITNSISGLNNLFSVGLAVSSTKFIFKKQPLFLTITRTHSISSPQVKELEQSTTLTGGNDYDVLCLGVPITQLKIDVKGEVGYNNSMQSSSGTVKIPATEECVYFGFKDAELSTYGRSSDYIIVLDSGNTYANVRYINTSYILWFWQGLSTAAGRVEFLVYVCQVVI
ncbi:MAG: DNRLRE domain-containing protein [Patescibacteria group bacterium]